MANPLCRCEFPGTSVSEEGLIPVFPIDVKVTLPELMEVAMGDTEKALDLP